MTTQTIPVGSSQATFSLGLGSYNVTAAAGKYTTISQAFTITQTDIEAGSKEIDLGEMEMGTHTFNVVVNSPESGEFTVTLKKNDATVETKQTVNKSASFTVTATEHTATAVAYTIEVARSGFKTVISPVEATQAEFRLSSSESVPVTAGSNKLTLTVVVEAETSVEVTVQ